VREWQDIYTQLRQVVKELGLPINSEPAEYREIHTALLTGLLSHIGMKDNDKQEFTGARNARFSIFPGSGLFKKPPKWTMVAELVETSRLWGRIAARIDPEWIEPVAQHLLKRSTANRTGSGRRGGDGDGKSDRLRSADRRRA
jgi:ATP-dependent helicase HrpA